MSFWPLLTFVATVVGSVFSYARNAPIPSSTTTTTMPAAAQPRRPNRLRRRAGRLRGGAAGDAGSSSGRDVDMDNGPRALCHGGPGEGERIEPGGVTAFGGGPQRVLAGQGHLPDGAARHT